MAQCPNLHWKMMPLLVAPPFTFTYVLLPEIKLSSILHNRLSLPVAIADWQVWVVALEVQFRQTLMMTHPQ